MRLMRARACGAAWLLLIAVVLGVFVGEPARATHSHSPNQWWPHLKPWGDHNITYRLCGLPYYLPPEWEWGIDNWDNQMGGYMDFNLAGDCFSGGEADVFLAWELNFECQMPVIACRAPTTLQWHPTGWFENIRSDIYFNYVGYEDLSIPEWEDAFQIKVSAHEWGHVLDLEGHERDACADPPLVHLLMGWTNPARPPCLTGPTSAEVNAVVADYGLLDTDFDGYSGALEWLLGTDPADACPDNVYDAAWPPDMTNNRAVDVLDVVKFIGKLGYSEGQPGYDRRYDLKPNFSVDILDVTTMIPLFVPTRTARTSGRAGSIRQFVRLRFPCRLLRL